MADGSAGDTSIDALIEAEWYLTRYPDIAGAGADPVVHYRCFGWREGRWPNHVFDPAWYRGQAGRLEGDPLLHYARTGEAAGLSPSEGFDPHEYRALLGVPAGELVLAAFLRRRQPQAPPGPDPALLAAVEAAGLFDANYYLLNSADVLDAGKEPWAHFCGHGHAEGRRPNPYFDTAWYRDAYGLTEAENPLAHYFRAGEAAGNWPCFWFDPSWYRKTYRVPETMLALSHFLANRHSQTVSPLPFFDVGFYVEHYGRTLRANRDPFMHYLTAGAAKGYDPAPWFKSAAYRQTAMAGDAEGNPLLHFVSAMILTRL